MSMSSTNRNPIELASQNIGGAVKTTFKQYLIQNFFSNSIVMSRPLPPDSDITNRTVVTKQD